MTATISEEYKCLVDILTCLVCKGMVTQAHICPNCSKFYCLNCIIRQLAVEQTCLNCNKFLEVSMLVNCQKLCCQLSETLEKVSLKRPESSRNLHQKQPLYCSKHRLEKTYYCKTCEKPLCSDCSVLTQQHRGHEFIKLSLMRNTYQSKVLQKIDEINRVQKNIEKNLEMEEVIKYKKGANNQENLVKFQGSIKLVKEELKKSLKKVLNEGEKRLEQMTQKLVKWNQIYDSHMNRLKNCSKGKFVERQYDILQSQLLSVLQSIDIQGQNDMNQINLHRKVKEISVSCIQPIYEEFTFLIKEYSSLFGQEGFFYTHNVQNKMGLKWRLKLYPEGINNSKEKNEKTHLVKKASKNQQEYFAIFIEFVDGCVQTTRQKYSLSLINQGNYNKTFTRQFESEFDIGQCWGYEHFIKLNQMYEDEYYNRDDDSLKIVLKICPSNYFQAARDQQALMKQTLATLNERNIQLNRLRNSIQSEKALASTSSLINLGSQREAL